MSAVVFDLFTLYFSSASADPPGAGDSWSSRIVGKVGERRVVRRCATAGKSRNNRLLNSVFI
jgi:hypothetical protein